MNRLAVLFIVICAFIPAAAQDKKKPPAKTEPRVIFAVPLGAAAGKTTRLTLRGLSLDDAKEVKVTGGGTAKILNKGKAGVPDKNPDKVGDTQVEIELKLNDKIAGDSISIVFVTGAGETKPHAILVEPATLEKEGNDGFSAAQAITLPAMIEGTIGRAKDVDVFRIAGKKGQKLLAEILASRHGSPLDAILTLYDANGSPLASNDDFTSDHRDARIETTLPADGVYFLSLIDAHDSGGNLHVYRLVVR